MATIVFERNTNTVGSPTWTEFESGNRLVFSGSPTDLATTIATTGWNDGSHEGSADPGADRCNQGGTANPGGPGGGDVHNNNVKFVDATNMSVNGGGNEAINDTNLVEGECTLRIHLNNASSVATQNTFFFNFDGTTDSAEAVEVETYAFERGVTASAWTQINDDSADIGGDNAGERLDLGEKSAAVDHYWYLALSSRGETAGGKTSHDFKIRTEIF
jgi:hypothetical protein